MWSSRCYRTKFSRWDGGSGVLVTRHWWRGWSENRTISGWHQERSQYTTRADWSIGEHSWGCMVAAQRAEVKNLVKQTEQQLVWDDMTPCHDNEYGEPEKQKPNGGFPHVAGERREDNQDGMSQGVERARAKDLSKSSTLWRQTWRKVAHVLAAQWCKRNGSSLSGAVKRVDRQRAMTNSASQTWKTLDPEEGKEKHEEYVQSQEKKTRAPQPGEREEHQEKNQAWQREAEDLERELDVRNDGGKLARSRNAEVVKEKCPQRRGNCGTEKYGHQEWERTERQERKEETLPGGGSEWDGEYARRGNEHAGIHGKRVRDRSGEVPSIAQEWT